MSYMSYSDQIRNHINFLNSKGLDVYELEIGTKGFIRCHQIGETKGRGDLCYKTTLNQMTNGCVGLVSTFRDTSGNFEKYSTYGLPPNESEQISHSKSDIRQPQEVDNSIQVTSAKKAYGFWQHSQVKGESDYLKRKDVGCYDIRFRTNEYGNVAVIPMYDINGWIWSYQLLNPDGSKRFPENARTEGLFHPLRRIINGQTFGIAESYVTAATCMEITCITCVCCFSCNNIKDVTVVLANKYPDSRIVIFADNDRHLQNGNQGVLKAQGAQKCVGDRVVVVAPDFGNLEPSKEVSDWNDLFRLKGKDEVQSQIFCFIGVCGAKEQKN